MSTQLRPASDRFSSFWILGSATAAMVPFIVAISCMPPRVTIAAINRRDGRLVGESLLVRPSVVDSMGMGSLIPPVLSSSEVALCRLVR